jgi:hypothetical protein
MNRILSSGLAAAGLALCAALGSAQIERLDLGQMVARTDSAVRGRIVAAQVVRIDHPTDGDELYYTHLAVEGQSLYTGKPASITVTFPGGFISPEQGVHNSEAPTADEIKLGNEVIVFSKWSDNMGGDLAANALYASHGGIYQVVQNRNGEVALGKGEGYAISANVKVSELKSQIGALLKKK